MFAEVVKILQPIRQFIVCPIVQRRSAVSIFVALLVGGHCCQCVLNGCTIVGEPSEQLHRGSRQSGGISRKYYNILLNILLLGGGWVGCSSSNNNSSKIVVASGVQYM